MSILTLWPITSSARYPNNFAAAALNEVTWPCSSITIANYLRTGEARIIGYGRLVKGLTKDGAVFPME